MTTCPFPPLTLQCVNRLQQHAQYFGCAAGAAIEKLMDVHEAQRAATQVWEGLPVGTPLRGSTGLRRSTRQWHFARVVERGIEVNGHIYASLSRGANAAVVNAGRTGCRSGFDFWKVDDDSGRMITVREFLKRRITLLALRRLNGAS